ncbi:hypothetical protein ACN27B_08560 [Micromonospora sp. WMMD754]|uniref:hypothetical protein n=1 Tax=Micromonospora sp. WMMD754 TaxID=3404114 RepID=UPI003BF5E151
MTQPSPPVADADDLPPTQYLILEVLAARHRTGETLWTFPAKLRPHMDALANLGLIGWKSGITEGTIRAWLTEQGLAAAISPTYITPNAEWSIRYPGGTVNRVGTFTEAGARQRADELGAEAVWRPVGPWQPAPATAEVTR